MKGEARSIGPIAGRNLRRGGFATVIASFERSLYLETEGGMVCVVDRSLYDGPLNLVLRIGDVRDLGAAVGQRWLVGEKHLSRQGRAGAEIDLRSSVLWRPRPEAVMPADRLAIADGLSRMKTLIAARAPTDGLLRLALDPTAEPHGTMEQAALAPLRSLRRLAGAWLDHGDQRVAADGLADLLGLGPGLTPSGDDLIAGLLIAAHRLGKGEETEDLWRRLAPRAKERTTPLSLAHLSAAGEGMGAAPIHDLLDALFESRGDCLSSVLDSVARIGHSSGFDAVAGVLLLLDAWIETGAHKPAAA